MAGGFGFLKLEAAFEIGEGIAYDPSDSYGRAFVVGLVNTLVVSASGIVLATILGVVAGVARLARDGDEPACRVPRSVPGACRCAGRPSSDRLESLPRLAERRVSR